MTTESIVTIVSVLTVVLTIVGGTATVVWKMADLRADVRVLRTVVQDLREDVVRFEGSLEKNMSRAHRRIDELDRRVSHIEGKCQT